MSELPFINKMAEYQADVDAQVKSKNEKIAALQQKVNDKQKEIDVKQAEYSKKPSEALFQKLLSLKGDLARMKVDVNSADEIISIPPVKTVSQEEIVKDVEDFIDSLKLQEFKDNIVKAKQDFLKNIVLFEQQLDKLSAIKEELRPLDFDKKDIIPKVLNDHINLLSPYDAIELPIRDIETKRMILSRQAANITTKF
jgi:peptidoglycan hydrolase CwlO-like protein